MTLEMSSDFTIRVATPNDELAVSALLEASYSVLMGSGYDPATLSAVLPVITRANPKLLLSGTYYVAEATSLRIVGCGGWTHEQPGNGDIKPELGHIRHFATHPDWLGRTVGRSIYAVCEQAARSAGMRYFECYSSLNAEGFYAALGFETIRRIEVRMGNNEMLPSILMRRSI